MVRKKNSEKKTPSVKFVVCSTHRCGSNLLCDMLGNYLFSKDNCDSYRSYEVLKQLIRHFSNSTSKIDVKVFLDSFFNTYGFIKIHYPHIEEVYMKQKTNFSNNLLDVLPKYFPSNVKYVYIYRSDIVSQSVSFFKAQKSFAWSSKNSLKKELSKKDFDLEHIRDNMFRLKRSNRLWGAFFKKNNITPIRVNYETFSKNASSEIERILKELGVHEGGVSKIKTSLQKQSDSLNTYFIQKYTKEENWFLFHIRYFIYLVKTDFYIRSFFWKKQFPLYKKLIFMYKRILRYFV